MIDRVANTSSNVVALKTRVDALRDNFDDSAEILANTHDKYIQFAQRIDSHEDESMKLSEKSAGLLNSVTEAIRTVNELDKTNSSK